MPFWSVHSLFLRIAMRATFALAVLALLGRATAFSVLPAARCSSWKEASSPARQNAALALAPTNIAEQGGLVSRGALLSAPRPRGGSALRASDLPPAGADSKKAPPLDLLAVGKYIAGTAVEFGIIMGLLTLLQRNALLRLADKWAKATVFLTFGFLAMKSRTFAVLNARRPGVKAEKEAKMEERRPSWMPPPKVFPFIWITIGILRAVSTTMVWVALGRNLVTVPVASMVLHLSIGDTWNHINNVEKKLGVAVSVVFLVWLSLANVVFRYYQTLPKAGLVLLPSLVWISVANFLVQSIWRLNGKEPLYPPKTKEA